MSRLIDKEKEKEINAVIDDAVKFLESSLNSVYCDTCRHNDSEDDSTCDYCNRKQMEWSISNNTAWSLVYTIERLLKRNMKFDVKEFKYIPGENDREYIRLLEEHLEIEKKITSKAIARVKELSKKQKENDWIPCSDRLPEKEGFYLITVDDGDRKDVNIDFFYFRGDGVPSWHYEKNVIAWMPLPESWEGEQE